MKYVINLATKAVHIDSCCRVRDFAKKDGRKVRFCKTCQPNLKGKEVR